MVRPVRNTVNGYTFIELLIALALLGIVVAPLLTLFATGYSLISDARMHTTALNLCRARIEETRALGYGAIYDLYLAGGASPVTETDPLGYAGFTRETTVFLVDLPTVTNALLPVQLLRIDVTVSWHANNREHEETLSAYLGKR